MRVNDEGGFRCDVTDVGGGVLVVQPWGELDLVVELPLRRAVSEACTRAVSQVVVDLTEVPFMDSTALSALIAGRRLCGESVRFTVRGANPVVLRLFQLTRLDELLDVESAERALSDVEG